MVMALAVLNIYSAAEAVVVVAMEVACKYKGTHISHAVAKIVAMGMMVVVVVMVVLLGQQATTPLVH